jgi:hypothetical protein
MAVALLRLELLWTEEVVGADQIYAGAFTHHVGVDMLIASSPKSHDSISSAK